MGSGCPPFNAYTKDRLHWLSAANVVTATKGGTYRIFPVNERVLADDKPYALRIAKDVRDYSVEFRQKRTGNRWAMNGVVLRWSPWRETARTMLVLDAAVGEPKAEWVTTVRLVGNQSLRLLSRPAGPGAVRYPNGGEGFFDERDFRLGRRVQVVSQRKTPAVDHHHPLSECVLGKNAIVYSSGASRGAKNRSEPTHERSV